jgi:hypothetical protein
MPPRQGVGEYGFACIEGVFFGARPRGVPPPPGPLMSLASAKVAPLPQKSRRLFRDVLQGRPQRLFRPPSFSRLWSQIQRRFYGHDDLSARDETL